jgi:ppGpp synthetase/RelA/SpoT-type nucleotidyltranferase
MADRLIGRTEFDFAAHGRSAAAEYAKIRPLYEQFAIAAKRILDDALINGNIKYNSIDLRAKDVDSFGKKAAKPSELDPKKPKYPNPMKDITDMAGIRVITFLPRTVNEVCECIEREFTVLEKIDKSLELIDEGKFGYQSIHFLLKMNTSRSGLTEYQSYKGLKLEVQVRTILQHAWAEMEHDIQYKSPNAIPTLIKRRFIALAGLLEIADREFQTLQDENERHESNIENYIASLRKSYDEGDASAKEYAIEALKDLSLLLESEKMSEKRDLGDQK